MAETAKLIPVQVCYARPERQLMLDLEVADGSTVRQTILASGIMQQAPEIDLASARVGIYGKLKPLDSVVQAHDRIEIYRPLIADPKESRRRRASLARKRKEA